MILFKSIHSCLVIIRLSFINSLLYNFYSVKSVQCVAISRSGCK